MKQLLKKYFGYDEFRPLQEDIINHVIQKKDALVLMPTGGGKSLCYQLPALYFDGFTLIISPLIALMKDQVDGLKLNGISAEFINSSLSASEIINIQNKVRLGEVKILYAAPERLAMPAFQSFLRGLKINLIAIDEAHCISEWGHDFRPDYRNLKQLRTVFPHIPIMALTATATPRVREDIVKQLDLNGAKFFISSFNRPNLTFTVRKKQQQFGKLVQLLNKYPNESVIIYCFSRKDTENLASRLQSEGFKALPYHAGLDKRLRKQTQDQFIKDDVSIIVATIAFGMGIDKSNIRLIVHYTFPKSIEGYYQEIGRAGRDGLPGECVMFYGYFDRFKHEYFIKQISDPSFKHVSQTKLNQIIEYCEKPLCRREYLLNYFGEKYFQTNCGACDKCLDLEDVKVDEDVYRIKKTNKRKSNLQYDPILFDELRVLRKQLADEQNVPPFVIFSDVILQEMAYYLPQTTDDFANIQGVGKRKLEKLSKPFLKIICEHTQVTRQQPMVIPDRRIRRLKRIKSEIATSDSKYNITKMMLIEKRSLKEIALRHGLKESTIVRHIEKLIAAGEKLDLDYLRPSAEDYSKIKTAFLKCGDEKLSPVFEYLKEKYPYEQLRLVRLIDRRPVCF